VHIHLHNAVIASERQAVDLVTKAYNTAVSERKIRAVSARGFKLGMDWSRSGTYGNPYEDASVYADTDITIAVGRATSRAAADLPVGTLDFKIDDGALVYAPERAASPLYGKVAPGVPGRLDLTVSGVTAPLLVGSLDKFSYDPNEWSLSGTLVDAWGVVANQTISTPIYRDYRTGDLINVVLDEIDWPADKRTIDPGATLVLSGGPRTRAPPTPSRSSPTARARPRSPTSTRACSSSRTGTTGC
jgi:hypothetical protein